LLQGRSLYLNYTLSVHNSFYGFEHDEIFHARGDVILHAKKFRLLFLLLILFTIPLLGACKEKQPPQPRKPTVQKKADSPGCVTLYEHVNFKGKAKKFCQDTPYFKEDFNDQVSSFRADCSIDSFTLYEHRDYQGKSTEWSGCSSAEELPNGMNDLFSSLKIKQ
jgi:hypothetical protein